MKYCTTCRIAYSNDVNSCPTDNSALTTTSELLQGLIIGGKFEILEKIGAGGMASVYRARHIAFDEIRAVKVVRHGYAEDAEFVRRLRSEAIIARKLKHPNAVHVDDLERLEDGRPFIVMEYIEGTNLRALIRTEGPLSCQRALKIARQIASALEAAHGLGIIHRDIKPDNVVLVLNLGGEEQVKVLDFGIAKIATDSSKTSFQTREGVLLCTPEYASPEQARGSSADKLDGRSDLYSLGIVLFEMLTGELPFKSDTPMGMLLAQISTVPRLPAEVNPGIRLPASVSALLEKALQKEPQMRFQSAREFIQALDKAAEDMDSCPMTSVKESAPVNENESEQPVLVDHLLKDLDEPGSNRTWLYALVLVLVLGIGAGAWWWHKSQQSEAHSAAAVTERVQQALARDLAASRLHAVVNNGVVVLSGEVNSKSAIDDISSKLANLDGVFQVEQREVRVMNEGDTPISASTAVPAPIATSAVPHDSQQLASRQTTQVLPQAAVAPPAQQPVHEVEKPQPDPVPKEKEVDPRVSSALASAQTAEKKGDYVGESRYYDAVLAVDPSNRTAKAGKEIAAALQRARKAHDDGAYDEEIRSYESVLKLDPGNAVARKGKAKAVRAKQADPGAGAEEQ